jgi:hypothetical protein
MNEPVNITYFAKVKHFVIKKDSDECYKVIISFQYLNKYCEHTNIRFYGYADNLSINSFDFVKVAKNIILLNLNNYLLRGEQIEVDEIDYSSVLLYAEKLKRRKKNNMAKVETLAKITDFRKERSGYGHYKCTIDVLFMFPDREEYSVSLFTIWDEMRDIDNGNFLKIARYIVEQKINWYVPANELVIMDEVDFSYFDKYEIIED